MFADLLRNAAKVNGSQIAIQTDDASLRYFELFERSCRLANALLDAGLEPGDRVSSLGRNQLASMEEVTGVALAGLVRSPLYMQDTAERQAFMIGRVGAKALIVDRECWEPLRKTLLAGNAMPKLVLVRGLDDDEQQALAYEAALDLASSADPGVPVAPDNLYIVRFSAGTTGMPKPIAHTARAYYDTNETVISKTDPLDPDDVYLAASPYSHGSGNMVWPFVRAGASHLVTEGGFDPQKALRLIQEYRCTTLFLVPTMIKRLLDCPDLEKTDLSSIRRIFYGAAPISPQIAKRARQVFGDVLCQLYGQSELVAIASLSPADHAREEPHILNSAGKVFDNCEVRIESEDGSVLPVGEAGEIIARSTCVMAGIFDDTEATEARFTADGWLRTNDVGRLSKDGYLEIVDRKDDMIISGGFNIAPSEIEAAYYEHTEVEEVVAFGVPHLEWGSTPVVVIKLRDGSSATEESLLVWGAEKLGRVKKPSSAIVAEVPLPRNAAGKLLRGEARQRFYERP